MNAYEAVKAVLVDAVPEAEGRVFYINAEYKNQDALIEDQKPFVTYQFERLAELGAMDGGTGLYNARVEIDCFGASESIVAEMDQKIRATLTGRVIRGNAELTLVPEPDSGVDVFEGDDIRRFVRMWKGTMEL